MGGAHDWRVGHLVVLLGELASVHVKVVFTIETGNTVLGLSLGIGGGLVCYGLMFCIYALGCCIELGSLGHSIKACSITILI